MNTIIRRKRTSRLSISPYRRHELLTGHIVYPVRGYSGYGDGVGTDLTKFISDEMRNDWRNNRDELMAFWKSGAYTTATMAVRPRQRRHAAVGGKASGIASCPSR